MFNKLVFSAILTISILSIDVMARNYSKPLPEKSMNLKKIPYKLVYESFQNGNWDIHIINADGTGERNLTNTSGIHELYPKVSPNGREVCFVADRGEGRNRKRDLYVMDIDGTNRRLISKNSRQPAWSPDGKYIAFVKAESSRRFSMESWSTKGLYLYNTQREKIEKHPNSRLEHLYNLAWTVDGKYITATVLGGMGYRHTNIAIERNGKRYFRLGIIGCRPESNAKGNRIAWGRNDREFRMAPLNMKRRPPVSQKSKRRFIKVKKGYEIYHIDWSPDDKFVAFTYGPKAEQKVGGMAPGWNICIGEVATGKWTMITSDGNHNKEPDWIPEKK